MYDAALTCTTAAADELDVESRCLCHLLAHAAMSLGSVWKPWQAVTWLQQQAYQAVLQDSRLQEGTGSKQYFMPTSMDKGVVAFRLWLKDLAGPIPCPKCRSQ